MLCSHNGEHVTRDKQHDISTQATNTRGIAALKHEKTALDFYGPLPT